jgi:hypothetical protein
MIDTTRTPATTEVGWIAREARALIAEYVPADSARRATYMERKQALLQYVGSQA